ncbi:T9SS type A sorting domain-containing protein [candidate division WOR-3 bacterium]|nr:T9SS type A sorting domain-containing protein [candidate division WOR-3 bacterium]
MVMFLLLLGIISLPEDKGITVSTEQFKVSGDNTNEVLIGEQASYDVKKIITERDKIEWVILDSIEFRGIIPAGEKCLIEVNSFLDITPPIEIYDAAWEAIEAVPDWLKLPLTDKFSRMEDNLQRDYSWLIVSSDEIYRDEIAFCVAYIDPVILSHYVTNLDFFIENVQRIYEYDTLLDYVELVEYPDYTTARYKISDHGSDTTDVEIPYERYYWDIVHPIISDEAPLYINPGTGSEAEPPLGRFWREYIFEYPDTAERTVWNWSDPPTDTIYAGFVSPILRDELNGVGVLWDGRTDIIDGSAIGVITQWIQDIMVFNSGFGFARPIQPVRIYHIHVGRCGEHADITAAAGRACLIPTNSPLSMCNDHTWNEWYDTQWRGWEPVNGFINSTYHYEGWGWNIVLPFNFSGDGYIWDVTERYSDICTLTVGVNDLYGNPVDGAMVTLASTPNSGSGLYYAGWHYTGSDGTCQFIIGDNKPYYARIDASIGYYPDSGYVTEVITNSVTGQHYFWSYNLSGSMPYLTINPDTLPDEPDSIYKVELEFLVDNEIKRGKTRFENELDIQQEFARLIEPGNIDFFICDSSNYSIYFQGQSPFNAFCIGEDVISGNISFILPEEGKWYAVLSNEDELKVGEIVSLQSRLYINESYGVEVERYPLTFSLSPNPTRSSVDINLTLPKSENISINIYDLSGRYVIKIIKGQLSKGYHNIKFDGRDLPGGIYFVRLTAGRDDITKKVVVIR